eukprot:TRINITY_DN23436_c0_g1_i1.p1 TRINITY_DN23436_c0_g1~~TRINITY_DN23436_c0_g1_i1.p1  ORF type:complete len:649 (+),score=113.37 TRINITY_DN23436_c0_g1_i1:71-1948(+)
MEPHDGLEIDLFVSNAPPQAASSQRELELQTLQEAAAQEEQGASNATTVQGLAESNATTVQGLAETLPADQDEPAPPKEAELASSILRPTPRVRSSEVVDHEEELRETFRSAAERPVWGPTPALQPKGRTDNWNHRHQLMWANEGQNPNTRSYFDRFLESKELLPPNHKLVPQKPIWRLDPDAHTPQQRQTESDCMTAYSPAAVRLTLRGPAETQDTRTAKEASAEQQKTRQAMRLSRDKPWIQSESPKPYYLLPKKKEEGIKEPKVPARKRKTDAPELSVEERKERGWDDHHHITWSNHQNLQSEVLNPPSVRNYFDRHREPDIGARSAEKKPPSAKDGVMRVLPVWRLSPTPDSSEVPEVGKLWPREPMLASRTGSGGNLQRRSEILGPRHDASREVSHKSTWRCPSPTTSVVDKGSEKRQKNWNSRHALLFKNEEVSRLDRSYFDRYREHLEMVGPDSPKRANSSVWSLGRDLSWQESAVIVGDNPREKVDARWSSRHHVFFDNTGDKLPVHQNLRSYFDRFREPPAEAVKKGEEAPADDDPFRPGYYAVLTEAAEGRRRCKLKDSDKLKVEVWSLVDKKMQNEKKFKLEDNFRRCESDPAMSKTAKEKRRKNWFSSHGVVF